MRTSLNHQPEAQHPKSPATHKLAGRLPIFRGQSGHRPGLAKCPLMTRSGPIGTIAASGKAVTSFICEQSCSGVLLFLSQKVEDMPRLRDCRTWEKTASIVRGHHWRRKWLQAL